MPAVVHLPGEGERVGGPTSVTINATGDDTGGSLYLGEVVLQPESAGPPPHVHEHLHDMFYVLAGTLTMRLGDDSVDLPPGGFACVPPATVHTFANRTDREVRFLNFNTPGGWEHYMRDLRALLSADTPPTPADIAGVAARYDFRPIGPG